MKTWLTLSWIADPVDERVQTTSVGDLEATIGPTKEGSRLTIFHDGRQIHVFDVPYTVTAMLYMEAFAKGFHAKKDLDAKK